MVESLATATLLSGLATAGGTAYAGHEQASSQKKIAKQQQNQANAELETQKQKQKQISAQYAGMQSNLYSGDSASGINTSQLVQ
jgi:uncharacterized protein (DUF2252 family)